MKPWMVGAMLCAIASSCRHSDAIKSAQPSGQTTSEEMIWETGQPLDLAAAVASFAPRALWTHFSDGYAVYDSVTLVIATPPSLKGRELEVYFDAKALPDNSPFRQVGTRCTFRIDPELLKPPKPGESRWLHDGALDELTVLASHDP